MNQITPQLDDSDLAILRQAEELLRNDFSHGLSKNEIYQLNDQHGLDLTTAVLYAHFQQKLTHDWFTTAKLEPTPPTDPPPTIAIAPGAFHQEHPDVGADGRELAAIAQRMQWPCHQIPTASLGTLAENAAIISRWFDACETPRVILVSLSKGAADCKLALEGRPELWDRLQSWICVSGMLWGTPIVDWLLQRRQLWPILKFLLWRRQLTRQALVEVQHRDTAGSLLHTACSRNQQPIQIVGFPLRKHLSCWRARLWHRRFRSLGPNDSVILLTDLLETPGTVIPIWGADHYLEAPLDVSQLVVSIVQHIMSDESNRPQATHGVIA